MKNMVLRYFMAFAFLLGGSMVACAAGAPEYASGLQPKHMVGYAPYTITSAQLGKPMSSKKLEQLLLCRTDPDSMVNIYNIVKSYDEMDAGSPDSDSGYAYFRGKQNGKDVQVRLIFTHHPQMLMYIWVDDTVAAYCG